MENRTEEWREMSGWEEFRTQLEAAQSLEDALKILIQAPRHPSPYRRYYSNLRFFLSSYRPPAGADDTEKGLYIRFIRKLGNLPLSDRERIEEALKESMSA